MLKLAEPLRLRCGAFLPNRMLKSAMSEALGAPGHLPPPGLGALSARWPAAAWACSSPAT